MGSAAGASEAAAAARVRPPRPADWGTMTRGQRKHFGKGKVGGHARAQVMAEPGLDLRTHFRYIGGKQQKHDEEEDTGP